MAGSIEELSRYRFSRAKEELDNARGVFEEGKFKMALNRSYYSMFHAMRSVNVLDEFDSSKHSGVIAHFNQYYVKEGHFPKEASKIVRNASEMREQADYEDFFTASRQDAEEQIKAAERFCYYVEEFLIINKII